MSVEKKEMRRRDEKNVPSQYSGADSSGRNPRMTWNPHTRARVQYVVGE